MLGGGCGGAAGATGWGGLEGAWWLWKVEVGILELDDGPEPMDSFDPPCGCFLGMVKLLFVTLRAPVAWRREPGGPEDEKTGMGGGGGPGFLDLGVLVWGGCFFESLALLAEAELALPLDAATGAGLADFEPGDFLPPFGPAVVTWGFFSTGTSFFSGSDTSVRCSSFSF